MGGCRRLLLKADTIRWTREGGHRCRSSLAMPCTTAQSLVVWGVLRFLASADLAAAVLLSVGHGSVSNNAVDTSGERGRHKRPKPRAQGPVDRGALRNKMLLLPAQSRRRSKPSTGESCCATRWHRWRRRPAVCPATTCCCHTVPLLRAWHPPSRSWLTSLTSL